MSAFTVGPDHIDLLVTAMSLTMDTDILPTQNVEGTPVTASYLGTVLLEENYRSVNYRYTEQTPVPEYHHEPVLELMPARKPTVYHWIQVLKAINCYEYQSCEHPGWEGSIAKAWMERLTLEVELFLTGHPRRTRAHSGISFPVGYEETKTEWHRSYGFWKPEVAS